MIFRVIHQLYGTIKILITNDRKRFSEDFKKIKHSI